METFVKKWLFDPTIGRIVLLFIGFVVIVLVINLLRKNVNKYVEDKDSRYRTKKFLSFFGYLLGISLIIVVYAHKLGNLTVALGVAGAGIAFALQEVISSIAGWLAIMFGNYYRTGDRVQLGGIKGEVIDIGIIRTTVMEIGQWVDADLYNGRIVRIANSFVFKEPVFNYSADFPFLWDEIKIPIKYGSDYQLAREIFYRIAQEIVGDYVKFAQQSWEGMVKKYLIEDASTEPMVTLMANDNWVEFTLRYVVDYKKRRSTKDQLFTRILEETNKSEGKIAFASTTLHLV
ncbi:MAG TPA: mechanosensitive ion channel family protein [candidate division Zixibacteria bacterium]